MDCRTLGILLGLPGDLEARGWGLVMCRTREMSTPSHLASYQLVYSRWVTGGRPAGGGLPGTRLDAVAQSGRSWGDARQHAIAVMRRQDARHDP